MIFNRSLHHELNYTSGAVFLVLLTVMLAAMVIRIVGLAAIGTADPSKILVLIGLQIVRYFAILLIATLYISIIIVLTRWKHDEEINIWLSSGLSLLDFLKPFTTFTLPLLTLITFFALVGWPWANKKQTELFERFKQSDSLTLFSPGQFHESSVAQRVFFIEEISGDNKQLINIFTAKIKKDGFEVVIANKGNIKNGKNGERYIILENGALYEGNYRNNPFKAANFKQYGIRLEEPSVIENISTKSKSTLDLLRNPTKNATAELSWRIGLILMGIILMMIAVPLAIHNTRKKGSLNFIVSVLIFFTYSNLLNLLKAKIAYGNLNIFFAFFVLHGSAGLIATFFFLKSFDTRSFLKITRNWSNFLNH